LFNLEVEYSFKVFRSRHYEDGYQHGEEREEDDEYEREEDEYEYGYEDERE